MAKNIRKPIYEEDWFDELDDAIGCNKQDIQKIKSVQKKEYKNKRERKRKREGFY